MITTAIILAGGLGTRLRPLTDTTPKPLLLVAGKPILQQVIENARKYGVRSIILSIGYKAEQIQEYFKTGAEFGVHLSYSVETEPLGTGGAIKQALGGIHQPVFIVWGDNLMDLNYHQLYQQYCKQATTVTMTLTHREDVENFGVARLQGEKVIAFVEKPARERAPSNLINAGAIILDPAGFSSIPDGKSSIEYDFYEKLKPGEITAYIHPGMWFPTDTLEKLEEADKYFRA